MTEAFGRGFLVERFTASQPELAQTVFFFFLLIMKNCPRKRPTVGGKGESEPEFEYSAREHDLARMRNGPPLADIVRSGLSL